MLAIRERKTTFMLSTPLTSKRGEDTVQAGFFCMEKNTSKSTPVLDD
jgi:hypothetical protein